MVGRVKDGMGLCQFSSDLAGNSQETTSLAKGKTVNTTDFIKRKKKKLENTSKETLSERFSN